MVACKNKHEINNSPSNNSALLLEPLRSSKPQGFYKRKKMKNKRMIKVTPCHPTMGKVPLILNEVFKLSRWLGTFPIDSEYSSISKFNLAKGVVLYFLTTAIAMASSYSITHEDVSLSTKVTEILKIFPIIVLHWTNLASLVLNRRLMKGLCDELKDIEYQFWLRDIDWFYKPSWCTKYLSCVVIMVSGIIWEIYYKTFESIIFRIPNHITYISLFSITSQYLALLQLCLSIMRQIRTVDESLTVIKLNDKLLTICQNVNILYDQQLLLYIINIFVIILSTLYMGFLRDMSHSIGKLFWKVTLVYPLMQITLYAGYISQEVKKTNKMLYRRLLNNLDDETLYFHLVAKREIVFTSCGFFKLENTLIYSMIATGMDYFIFLIQYI